MGTKTKKRTEVEILAATGTPVTLGGRDYTITPKPRGQSRLVRQKLGELLEHLSGASGLITTAMSDEVVELDGSQLSSAMPLLNTLLGPRMDELLDIVYDYEPTIAADRVYLEGEDEGYPGQGGTDAEFVSALMVIVGFCFSPLLKMAGQTTMTTGQTQANNGNGGASSTAKAP